MRSINNDDNDEVNLNVKGVWFPLRWVESVVFIVTVFSGQAFYNLLEHLVGHVTMV